MKPNSGYMIAGEATSGAIGVDLTVLLASRHRTVRIRVLDTMVMEQRLRKA